MNFEKLFQDALPVLAPDLVLVATACVLFIGATFKADRKLWGMVSLASLIVAGIMSIRRVPETLDSTIFIAPLVLDSMGYYVKLLAYGGGILLLLLSWDNVPERYAAEYNACLLLLTAGVSLTGCANELVMLFLALELISIPTYVLLYLPQFSNTSQEAATKYFLLSVFSSGFLLFGFSYLYGLSGSTNLPTLMETLQVDNPAGLPPLVRIALVMIAAGLGFKITAVPFHFYAPDVYQGTTPPLAAMLAFVPKVAGFAAFIRLVGHVYAGRAGTGMELGDQTPMLFYILAIVTMSLGNLLALLQDNLRRLLAYSSVAHAGYMLMGLAVASTLHAKRISNPETAGIAGGVDAILFYLVAYGAMTIGAFAVITYLSTPERPVETVDDLAGLSKSHPMVALVMTVFMFSLIGMPFTAGFAGKFLLFFGAIMAEAAEHPWLFRTLALVGGINAAIGGWYYLRIISAMYLRSPVKPLDKGTSRATWAAIGLCAFITIAFGIYPVPLLTRAQDAALTKPIPTARAER